MNFAYELARIEQIRLSGQTAEAERQCRQLLARSQDSVSVLNSLALLVRDRGEYTEAETLIRRAIALAPKEAALHNNLGNILRVSGNLAQAEPAYRQAIELNPIYAEAFFNLGIVLRELDQGDEAIAAHQRAVALRPTYASALVQLGILHSERGEKDEALRTLQTAVSAEPGLYDARYYLATVLKDLNRSDDALSTLQSAVVLRPQRYEGQYALAKALATAGREEEALSAYEKAILAAPDFEPAHAEFNELSWTMGRDVRGAESYAYARAKVGDKPDLLLSEAELRMRFTDAVAAEALLRRAHELAPDNANVANALGRSLALQSRFDESLRYFKQAIEAEPTKIAHRQELGVALLRSAHVSDSVRELESAIALAPHDQITLCYLSLALRETGDSRYNGLVDIGRFVKTYELSPRGPFSDIASFNKTLREELERLHTRQAAPLTQTLLNGTQTPGSLFANHSAALDHARELIWEAVSDYVRDLPEDPDHPFLARKASDLEFKGSWSCRLRSSGYHSNHVHNQGWISSAYYVSLPDEVSEATQNQGSLKFGESKFRLSELDQPAQFVRPAVGKLVLFPSYFWHGTVPFVSDDSRLTVAFDVAPVEAGVVASGSKRI